MDDYAVFSGWMLEGYFKAKFAEAHRYTRMGAWWDRKGENEIDLAFFQKNPSRHGQLEKLLGLSLVDM